MTDKSNSASDKLTGNRLMNSLEGMSLDDLVRMFEEKGIKGVRDDICFCPLANYTGAIVHGLQYEWGGEYYDTPYVAWLFLRAFDDGELPQFDETPIEEYEW